MGKKSNASSAGTSISKDIHDLKTLNSDLLKEVAEFRKQIEHLSSRQDSLIADVRRPRPCPFLYPRRSRGT
ncbi:hypothetical protein KFK09_014753 [Dendrobium nobile]|uniref:Uncharacterized protein n=1 Tax=Dendrobium nobile TaxID=94219 RepID=A0A8T3B304_DENNO|nr:hypothetical protein KFK09_014753 [Dendrobium nobile]